ncbi:MAG: uL15 family ribosomal protein, partial [Gammaproteobacteria bacterium]
GVVPAVTKKAKIIASGEISKAVEIRGIGVTPGAHKAIEAAGGNVQA